MADLVIDNTIEAIVLPNGEELELGKNPTGNIDITQAGVMDVSEYATATVPQADPLPWFDSWYRTVSGERKWQLETGFVLNGGDAGWASDDAIDEYAFNAIPTNTHITPSTSAQTIGAADTMLEGAVTVDAMPQGQVLYGMESGEYVTNSGNRFWRPTVTLYQQGYFPLDYYSSQTSNQYEAIAANTTVTPTESAQTIGGADTMMEAAVTVAAIPSNYVGSSITRRSSTDLTASGATVNVPSGYYASNASKAVASGSATASATKGTVSNHSVTVTPSVTRTAGYVTAGTASGTAVTVSASELVSGSQTITENGTVDCTNLAEIVVAVEGGGGGGVQIGKTTKTTASAASSIQFTGLSGNPTSFVIMSADDVATNTDGVTEVVFDGTSLHGQTMTTQVEADTGFTKSYSGGTLTVTATTASFLAGDYKLVYTYGGSASDIDTADIQVGSGATSITFPVSGRPAYWSCIFKSDFSTSSGYQRVIGVVNDGSSIYGLEMDSSAHAATSWTATYSGGNLTISSQSTNVGGYFHQPGYYQLTYYVDASAPQYQSKTVTPTTSQQVITPDNGYDALEQVTVNRIPSEYIIPSGNLAITQNGTGINVAQYSTVSVNVSGGGGSVNIDTKTVTASNYPTSISFSSMHGEPKAFFLRSTTQISSSGSTAYYYIIDMRYNGTNTTGNCFRIGSTRRVDNITSGYSWSYSGTTLTITSSASSRSSSPGAFNNGYELVYIY